MIVVSNASPLRYLVLVEADHVLPPLFGEVLIPPAVIDELQRPRTPDIVRRWAAKAPAWARVKAPAALDASLDVDRGEAEAISLAVELKAGALLIDDRKGRNAAQVRGIRTVGTLAVLEVAAERLLLDLPLVLDRLRRTNFRCSEKMLRAALERDRARRDAQMNPPTPPPGRGNEG